MFTNGLNNKVTIYVPSTTDVSQALESDVTRQHVERTLRFLASRFGGATAQQAVGAWVSADSRLIEEPVHLVYAFAQELSSADYEAIYAYVEALRIELKQEAVACELNGELFLIA